MVKVTVDPKYKQRWIHDRAPSSSTHQKSPAASRGGWSPPSPTAGPVSGDKLMDKSLLNIRNACILAPAGYDKNILVDSLTAAAGGISKESPSGFHLTRARSLASEVKTIDHNSVNVSICYEMKPLLSHRQSYKGEMHGNKVLINLINVPGHNDIPMEATEVLSIIDGALIIVECREGFSMHSESVIRHALRERIRPVLCLNLIDEWFFSSQDGEKAYQLLFATIKNANDIMSKYTDKLLVDVQVYPQKGNVTFCSGQDLTGWGFNLTGWARYYAQLLRIDEAKAMEWLWGDKFFDSETKQWTSIHTGRETCKRGFVKFCYEPIKEIVDICMTNDRTRLDLALEDHGLALSDDEDQLEGLDLLKCFMRKWLPADKAVLDMMVLHLPSPVRAQEYRVENLYTGPLNDAYASAIRKCDPNGPLIIYITNMIPSSNKTKSFALGRVFSGKVESGMKVRIMGSNHVPGREYKIESLQCPQIFDGKKLKPAKIVTCGNVVALVGLHTPKAATITRENMLHAFPLRSISIDLEHHDILPDITLKPTASNSTDLQIPYHVYNDLFLHQRAGVIWLWTMHCQDSGGILADDMGLGKTRQVCTFLRGLFHSKLIKRAVVIAPPSVIEPWGDEFKDVGITNYKKFTDAKSKRHLKQIVMEGGLLCTTYGMFSKIEDDNESDAVLLDAQNVETWDYVFMDEGHRAKNSGAQIAKSLKKMKCKHKIIMTGTPIQNNMKEFHTLMDICKPSFLGDYKDFHLNYTLPFNRGKHRDAEPYLKEKSAQILSKLGNLTSPFVLRRTKQLLKDQGQLTCDKYEYTIWLELSPCQVKYYGALVTCNLLRTYGCALAATKIARDICRHPCVLKQNISEEENDHGFALQIKKCLFETLPPHGFCEDDTDISSKLSFILYLTHKLVVEEKHKVLVFSHSPHMLKILENALGNIMDKQKIIRMDGQTKRRDRNTMRMMFQGIVKAKHQESGSSGSSGPSNPNSSDIDLSKVSDPQIFLMTTKVGGVGLNLTAATRVIIADPSENPSDDNQAVDRAYRMGQFNNVIVYRVVTCATIEEHTYREQILKTETSFGLLEDQPCMKSICQKEGLVLSMPPDGFKFCKTQRELVRIYGPEMEVELSSDLHLHHEFAIKAHKHSLLFSVKEDKKAHKEGFRDANLRFDERKPKLKGTKKTAEVVQSMTIPLPKNTVDRLLAYKRGRLKKMQRATDAAMDIVPQQTHMLISSSDSQEIKKARKLVLDFVKEVESENTIVVYIPQNKAWVVLGTNGCTLTSIMEKSEAFVAVKDPERGRKDLKGQKEVQICGNLRRIRAARELILKELKLNGVQFTIEGDI